MRVLFLVQYYYPEIGAASNRLTAFAEYLADHGHKVTVVCSAPNYPSGRVYRGYTNTFLQAKCIHGVKIVRCWAHLNRSKNFALRLFHYLSFAITSFFVGVFQEKPDVVFVSAPPLFLCAGGIFLGKLRRVPVAVDVRDLGVESAVGGDIVSDHSAFAKVGRRFEQWVYEQGSHITVTTRGIKSYIKRFGIEDSRLSVLWNGSDIKTTNAVNGREQGYLRKQLGFGKKFVALYAGNIGVAQNPLLLLDCAEWLSKQHITDTFLVVVGGGVLYEDMKEELQKRKLSNIHMIGVVSKEDVQKFYEASDIGLVLLKNRPVFKDVIPAKLFDLWAAGLPVLLNTEGEAAELIRKSRSGIVVAPDDPVALGKGIAWLKERASMREKMRKNGRRLITESFSRVKMSEKLERILRGLVPPG